MRSIRNLLCLTLLATPALAIDKAQIHQEMLNIAQQMRTLKADPSQGVLLQRLEARYQSLSARMGGDDPAGLLDTDQTVPGSTEVVPTPPPGCTATTTNFANVVPTPILDVATVSSTITVSGVGTHLWDVDLNVSISHTFAADLDVTLTAPDLTVIKITTDNGGANDNVFGATRFDDSSTNTVADHVYVNNVPKANLCPEGALDDVHAIDPNGVWTLTITDDLGGDVGVLNNWSLDVTTLSAVPITGPTSASNNTPTAILDVATVSSTILVSGATGVLTDVNLTTFITHTFAADLDITLTSPTLTVTKVTTDLGGANDNVFNGTLWDDQTGTPVNDFVFTNNVTATPLQAEGHLSRFQGENPNGTWTLTITDDLGGDVGSLNSWTLDLQSGDCGPVAPVAFCDPNTGGVIPCPCGNPASGPNRGCDNSSATGGASITASGNSSLSNDTLVFTTTGEKPTATSIFLSWDATNPPGSAFGQGVNCGAGTLKRLYVKKAVAGSATAPNTGAGDPTVSQQHANKGDPLAAGMHRFYNVVYRDAVVLGGCPAKSTFNVTNMLDVTWAP